MAKWRIFWWLACQDGRVYGHDDVESDEENEEIMKDEAMNILDKVNDDVGIDYPEKTKTPNFHNAVNTATNPTNWGVRKVRKLS